VVFEEDLSVIEWAKEVNTLLLEFEGQLSISDINNLTRKEIYYLRRFRQDYHIKQKEEADKAADAARNAQEKQASVRRTGYKKYQNNVKAASKPPSRAHKSTRRPANSKASRR